MHDQIELVPAEQFFDGRSVTNVQCHMHEPLCRAPQPLQIPQRVAGLPKTHPTHLVVDAHNFVPICVEVPPRLRPNQSAASRHENLHASEPPRKDATTSSHGSCLCANL